MIGIVVFITMVLTACSLAYLSGRYLDYVESLLSNSAFVMSNRTGPGSAGVLGRMSRLYSIALMLAFPRFFIWRGLLDLNDFERFPLPARLWLVFVFYFCFFIVGALAFCDLKGAC